MADPENRRIPGERSPGSSSHSAEEKGSAYNPVNKVIEQFVGLEIYGGCESCDAFQTVAARGSGVYLLTVHHDEWCPEQRGREGRL